MPRKALYKCNESLLLLCIFSDFSCVSLSGSDDFVIFDSSNGNVFIYKCFLRHSNFCAKVKFTTLDENLGTDMNGNNLWLSVHHLRLSFVGAGCTLTHSMDML